MSAIRPRRISNFWSIHTDQTGNHNAVDTFQVLAAPTITGVTNGGTFLNIAITDTNAGADTFDYTYIVQRSVDGSAFSTIFYDVAGAILPSLQDNVMFVIGTTVTLADGSTVTLPPTIPTLVTMQSTPGFDPLTVATQAAILFDTVVTSGGHSLTLATGTIVTLPVGTNWTTVATPKGHVYAYKVAIQNKFETTAFSASSSVTVASAFTAQTQAAPTRVNNKVTLTWTDPNSYLTGQKIEIWKDVNGFGYALLTTIVKFPSVAMPTSYVDAFDFLTLVPATYSYKLRAVSDNPQDTGAFSNAQSLVVNFTLSQVTALTATPAMGDTQVNLAWTDPNLLTDEAGVYVDRAVGTGGQFQRLITLAAGTVAYSDVFQTEPGQTYQYRVTPFNALHAGPVSATASATTSLLTPTITALEQLADVGVRIFWSDVNQHASNYTVQRSVNGGAFSTVGTVGSNQRQFDDSVSLVIGDTVAYKVRAFNAFVTGTFSAVFSLLIHRILVAPTDVAPVFVQFGVVSVSWTGLNSGNRGVNIFKSVNGSATTLLATLPKDARSYVDLFQTIPGQVYAYQVQDFDNQETGPLSQFGVVSSPLDGPTSLQIAAVVPPSSVTLQWTTFTLPQSTNEDYISIERSFGGGFIEIGRVPFGQSPTFLASTAGGIPGGIVSFRVRKIKQPYTISGTITVPTNFGDYSQTVSTVTALSVPTAVTVTRSVAGVNSIVWTDVNTLATGFKVFRQVTVGGVASPLIQIATVNDATARSFNDVVESQSGEIFVYSVLAFNAQTSSVYSGFGTLTTRFSAPRIELTQPSRTTITIDWISTIGSGLTGDKLQLMRSLNGAPATVVATFNAPFFSGFLYTDSPVSVGDNIVYSARYFSTTELGPTSTLVSVTVGDIVDTPLGSIKQTRIHGARNKFVQRDVFAVGLGGIAKISFDPITGDPVIVSNTLPAVTNAYSGISGDQTRLIVFTGATPGSGQAVLVDAGNLSVITSTPMTLTDSYTYGGGAFTFGSAQIDYYADAESAPYLDGATGDYAGWGLVNFTPIFNMNSNFPLRLVPWTGTLTGVSLTSAYNSGTTGGQTTVAIPFTLASILPRRMENLNGDCVFCVNPTGNFTTMYRAQRLQNSYVKMLDIPGRVMDFVSDGVSKIVAVTLRGEIYLIDSTFDPVNPAFNIVGRVPGTPINDNGDLIDPTVDFITIELMANRKVAVAVGTHSGQTFTGPQSQSFIYIFDAPGVLVTNGSLTLNTTINSIEKIMGIAFDGMKYIYATSWDNQFRLIRFDAGF